MAVPAMMRTGARISMARLASAPGKSFILLDTKNLPYKVTIVLPLGPLCGDTVLTVGSSKKVNETGDEKSLHRVSVLRLRSPTGSHQLHPPTRSAPTSITE
jgi:hypothetical protein